MVIELKFDISLDRLIGYDFGKEIYLNQVDIMPIAEKLYYHSLNQLKEYLFHLFKALFLSI